MTPSRAKHIDIIQATVTRMAANSFLLRGWAVTLVSATFALAAKDANKRYIVIAFFPTLIFWALDGYYLSQERRYRLVFDDVRKNLSAESDLSMDTARVVKWRNSWWASMFAPTVVLYYGVILGTAVFAYSRF